MSSARIDPVTDTTASPEAKAVLAQIHGAFGATPNMFRTVARSPAALQSMWGSFGALGGGVIPAPLGEQIAVAVANYNGCDYCLAAHTALGRKAGVGAAEMAAAQLGESADPRTGAALRFALQLVERRGHVGEADVQALRDAGFDDAHIVEIVAHVALNLFTNYVNVAFAVPVDFPGVKLRPAAA
ncbi:putative peroxidase-related enzyme [Variovorax sp. TBS-050B]|uniref:carboxymuconolactone decarboxylase family protein n=1 Tax=Variovorax sp. TBS-050B TaxID=2940551 RepID=UPI0024753CEF|nr:peroxidase-related enzyme [Variovorax sp. TBS-050B]MDH6590612.1 putative peroxidase-related enzyme [Variovorax sp. TBS-050B]